MSTKGKKLSRAPFKHQNPRGRTKHIEPRKVPIKFPSDFLLALPEMRAELERQCQYGGEILVGRKEPW